MVPPPSTGHPDNGLPLTPGPLQGRLSSAAGGIVTVGGVVEAGVAGSDWAHTCRANKVRYLVANSRNLAAFPIERAVYARR